MIKNWITVAWRNIMRQKTTSLLNAGGLALGITGSLVIFMLISHLLSIDKFHGKADSIYRLVQVTTRNGDAFHTQGVPTVLPDAFREDFQDINESVFITDVNDGILIGIEDPYSGMRYVEQGEGVAYTENNFFKVFDRPIVKGSEEQVLLKPNEVVVSEKLAKTLFPEESAFGKEIEINKEGLYTIVGVMEDFADNTDFPFEVFISYPTIKQKNLESGWNSVSSDDQFYWVMPESLTAVEVEERLVAFEDKHYEQNDLDERVFYAQPLEEIHFDTRYGNYSQKTVNMSQIYAMVIVGFFLVLTGCINYVNLSTAVAMRRAKEVGVRKVLGGAKDVIIKQFLSETLIITVVAIVIALGLTELALQSINPMLDLNLTINLFSNIELWLYLGVLTLFITLLAGLYPAFVLSGFKPTEVLKKIISHRSSSGYQLRRALVVFQFVISQIFIIGTVIVLMQMNFIETKDMGFKIDAVLNINLPVRDTDKMIVLKNKLESNASINKASVSYTTPASGNMSITGFNYEGNEYLTTIKPIDENYIDLFAIPLIAGRNLTPSDTLREVIVNEKFLREIGIKSPEKAIGQTINMWEQELPIVGVVKDFHQRSLKDEIRPLAMFSDIESYGTLSVNINTSNISNTVEEIQSAHKEVYPEYSLNHEFFEDDIANFYEGERKMASILGVFSLVAIFIGCIGLYGLISYVAQQKVKEVGIRKVLGASVGNIMMIFSKEFVILLIIAFVIAAPLAGWGMGEWLNSFEYKIELDFYVYLTGILVTLLIAMATVGFKTFQAATANPVDSLNNE